MMAGCIATVDPLKVAGSQTWLGSSMIDSQPSSSVGSLVRWLSASSRLHCTCSGLNSMSRGGKDTWADVLNQNGGFPTSSRTSLWDPMTICP